MPQLHMPLQSGSDRILQAMRRSYRMAKYLGILDRVRAEIPHAAITTDIIVGFPGETDDEFEETLSAVRDVQFDDAFMFKFSMRDGTPAQRLPTELRVSEAVVDERFERLKDLVRSIAREKNLPLLIEYGDGHRETVHDMIGQIALADPSKSSSVTQAFEMLIQQQMHDAVEQRLAPEILARQEPGDGEPERQRERIDLAVGTGRGIAPAPVAADRPIREEDEPVGEDPGGRRRDPGEARLRRRRGAVRQIASN